MSNGRSDLATARSDRYLPQPRREDLDLATVLGALADHTRLTLVREFATGAEQEPCAGIATRLDIGPSTLSHHLRVLREAGITSTRVRGRHRDVTLRRDELDARFPGLLDLVRRG